MLGPAPSGGFGQAAPGGGGADVYIPAGETGAKPATGTGKTQPQSDYDRKYPKKFKNEAGQIVKRPDNLITDKPTKKDYTKAFFLGALTGGIEPVISGAVPQQYGGGDIGKKVQGDLKSQAGKLESGFIEPYRDSAKYMEALQTRPTLEQGNTENDNSKNKVKDAARKADKAAWEKRRKTGMYDMGPWSEEDFLKRYNQAQEDAKGE